MAYVGPPAMGLPCSYPMMPPPHMGMMLYGMPPVPGMPPSLWGYHMPPHHMAVEDRRRSRSRSPRGRGDHDSRWRGSGRTGGSRSIEEWKVDRKKFKFKPFHSTGVPKGTRLEEKFTEDSTHTTAMLRNIPNRYMQELLMQEIDSHDLSGTYDFFYLPMDTVNKANVGYAFINFLDPADLHAFRKKFDGYQFEKFSRKKIAAVSPAHIQGLEANLQHFVSKAVTQLRDSQYRPVVLKNGAPVDFEETVKGMIPSSGDSKAPVKPGCVD